MAIYREQGIILRTYKLGESDRIVNLLGQSRGKVRAVAKGVRKPGSRFGGRLEPFSHVELQLYEGRNLDTITQAELITSFAAVRSDYELSASGSAMVEAADRVAQEDERSHPLFLLLLEGLRALSWAPEHPASVLDGFLLRLASVTGWHPVLDACVLCATPGAHPVFSIANGGTVCERCAPRDAQRLNPVILDTLRQLSVQSLDSLGALATDGRAGRAAGALISSFLTYHLGQPLRAAELVPR
ncbi:MAG: DNA repair protein RecO [Egibacteraceae bacterium]